RMPPGRQASSHLAPFALRTAFPSPLVRRYSHDYYEACVALGLAPLRRSRVRPCHTYRARLRCPTHLLKCPHWASLRAAEVAPDRYGAQHTARRRFQASFRRTTTCVSWRLGFRQFSVGWTARRGPVFMLDEPGLFRAASPQTGLARFPGIRLSSN